MNNKPKVEQKTQVDENSVPAEVAVKQIFTDFKNSVLVVSLLVNLFMLTTWLVIEVTDIYNVALITYLQN